ncbi:MAG: phosphoheptose isomerase [Candidatus Zambryskibacteria bacterium RIFCSPHIGHO2_01_FULL_43_27]|uniref:Phosphoheptose isomerase n=1 Tax=Candidatus Zambryskibacteria bacterium RIFCSPLOWO2_01_FULL_43_17 TaxID=1802760 RepID=A0A1G2U3M5_9BACT|nr:MAG: phosphoheptose isomerase [Candidatus Zambryskibacteria bacterium RIFCSPHIGHO2_01_FULL_43_27]OHA99626.1 MAG: phosphoheptose isomerase [Candidatus Zambryskibacteria bacterium RIFCSPHIGHO2_12_FULL_43_12b]OHB04111.1 MAG: phosphoheptose isomerase [Candidatus Zambryskibacteria bacterium RIFCSPLOWO2_01_FULL_43_17]
MNSKENPIEKSINENLETINHLKDISSEILKVSEVLKKLIKNDGHLFVCGNGGSAADSQHIVGEFRGHFEKERKPLRASALSVDTSTITAIGNDYGFEHIFSRQVEALAKPNDVLIAISTSGNSRNILEATKVAKKIGLITIGLTGKTGGQLAKTADHVLKVPSNRTPRIQEGHELILHILIEMIDDEIDQ